MQAPEVKRAVSLLRVAAKQLGTGDVAERVAAALEPVGYTPTPPLGQAQREEWESLAALVGLARSHDSLESMVADLDERAENDDAPVAAAVTLASLHPPRDWSGTRSSCPARKTRWTAPCAIRGDGRRGGRTATVLTWGHPCQGHPGTVLRAGGLPAREPAAVAIPARRSPAPTRRQTCRGEVAWLPGLR